MKPHIILTALLVHPLFCGCTTSPQAEQVSPVRITRPVPHDSDDPAIWLNRDNPAESLVLGTDKHKNGGIYVFNLDGNIIEEKTVRNIARPNNIDIAYGMKLGGEEVDIAVVTERLASRLRVFRLPEMTPVDNGGIAVFEGEALNAPMGIALYKRKSDHAVFAIVSRKQGPADGTYLWQYLLEDDGTGMVTARKVRAFGAWSGRKEIEAVAVDDEAGYIYYSDEGFGVRKYLADPDAEGANGELALFATNGVARDHEGIAVCRDSSCGGWIILSDQSAGELHLYPADGASSEEPHRHELARSVKTSAVETDGIEAEPHLVTPDFPQGLLVAMSDDRTFHFYRLDEITGKP